MVSKTVQILCGSDVERNERGGRMQSIGLTKRWPNSNTVNSQSRGWRWSVRVTGWELSNQSGVTRKEVQESPLMTEDIFKEPEMQLWPYNEPGVLVMFLALSIKGRLSCPSLQCQEAPNSNVSWHIPSIQARRPQSPGRKTQLSNPIFPNCWNVKKFYSNAWSNVLSKTDITLLRDLFWVLKKVKTL